MKIATLLDSSYDEPSVYGPAPDEPLIDATTTNTIKVPTPTSTTTDNNTTKNNNTALIISNVLISVAILVLGIMAVIDKKIPKTAKILILIGILAMGAVILYFVNNIPHA